MVPLLTEGDAQSLISVFSALLAAFGFFYTGVRETVRPGTVKDPKDADERTALRGLVKQALWPGITVLAVSSCCVAAVMTPALIATIGSIGKGGSYSPSISAFGVLGVFWLVLALFWLYQVGRAAYRVWRW